MLAGLAPDFQSASAHTYSLDVDNGYADGYSDDPDNSQDPANPLYEGRDSSAEDEQRKGIFKISLEYAILRFFPLALWIIGSGYFLSLVDIVGSGTILVYVGLTTAVILGQAFLFPDRRAGLRELFSVSIFFLLTTPLVQFALIHMDHYNFHVIGNFAGTYVPHMLALLINLVLASIAGLMFHLLWRWQNSGAR